MGTFIAEVVTVVVGCAKDAVLDVMDEAEEEEEEANHVVVVGLFVGGRSSSSEEWRLRLVDVAAPL